MKDVGEQLGLSNNVVCRLRETAPAEEEPPDHCGVVAGGEPADLPALSDGLPAEGGDSAERPPRPAGRGAGPGGETCVSGPLLQPVTVIVMRSLN